MTFIRHAAALSALIYVVRLRPQFGDGIRELRQFLKAAGRLFHLRCVGISTEEVSGPRSSRGARRRHHRIGNPPNQESVMDQADRSRLKNYATTTRSHLVFGGVPFIPFDWKSGKYLVGKNKIDFTGRKFAADVANVMVGFREWKDGKPVYFLTRLLDKTVEPLERNELDQTDESFWTDGKDPLVAVTVLPVFDEETRQVFIITAAYGERSETGNVIDAFVDHNESRPDGEDELPIIQLCERAYTKNDGNVGHAMQLDVVGWTARPPSVLRVSPPPLTITVTETAKSNSKAKAAADDKTVKPKRTIEIPGKSEEVPF
jgi:hypothetical protein